MCTVCTFYCLSATVHTPDRRGGYTYGLDPGLTRGLLKLIRATVPVRAMRVLPRELDEALVFIGRSVNEVR